MWSGVPLLPERASTVAGAVDALFYTLVGLTVAFSALIAVLVVTFAVRYRRRSPHAIGVRTTGGLWMEVTWTTVPLVTGVLLFAWGASVFLAMTRPPDDALDVYAVGKQWMWTLQHVDGRREINELHVPLGRAVRLRMASEDVIHSFSIPAFRVKADVIPGRYTTLWFEPTRTGRFHLFCAEYCGTQHSGMVGSIVVMEPHAFQSWLAGGAAGPSLAVEGERLFAALGCDTCHREGTEGRGPLLGGLFGSTVLLQDGETVVVDESYLRRSILRPADQVTAGYQPIMPAFQGLVSEADLLALIEYLKVLP